MKFKSQLITQASGSIGGVTASRNKGGMYLRARAIPVNPGSEFQTAVRGYLSQLTALWSNTLTDAQRLAWANYAEHTPVVDSLGDSRVIPGLAMYVRSNVPRLQAGLARVDDGPTTFGLGDFTQPGITSITASTGVMIVTFEDTDEWLDETGSAMLVLTSRGQGPAINYFKGPFRYAGSILGDDTTPLASPQNITIAFTVAADQQVFSQFRVSRADGRLSAPLVLPKTSV